MADGYAVKELLKLADILYEANSSKYLNDEDDIHILPLDLSSKILQLKACRALASEITEQGSNLYDSLGKEIELREIRQGVISKPFDLKTIEKSVSAAVSNLKEHISKFGFRRDKLNG